MSTLESAEPGDDPVRELPPSAKLVLVVLEEEGALANSEIATETRLDDRTVRFAINRLQDCGLVDGRPSLQDARKTLYSVAD